MLRHTAAFTIYLYDFYASIVSFARHLHLLPLIQNCLGRCRRFSPVTDTAFLHFSAQQRPYGQLMLQAERPRAHLKYFIYGDICAYMHDELRYPYMRRLAILHGQGHESGGPLAKPA